MRRLSIWVAFIGIGSLICAGRSSAKDYLLLRNGQVIECAILKLDSVYIRTTDWNSRGELQPPLQVFTREEVQSISFLRPEEQGRVMNRYTRRANTLEFGGGAAFQTWAETKLVRRSLMQLHVAGGYSIVPYLGLELDGAVTIPLGGSADSTWRSFDLGYQVAMNIVGQPIDWKGLVPFALVGGGAALGMPLDHVSLSNTSQARNLVNFGAGVKTGADGVGFRLEWRHHFYTWTPDEVNEFGVRVPEHSADMSVVRASIFIYR